MPVSAAARAEVKAVLAGKPPRPVRVEDVPTKSQAQRRSFPSTTPRGTYKRPKAPARVNGREARDWATERIEATRMVRHDLHMRPGLLMVACPGPAHGGVLVGPSDYEEWRRWAGCIDKTKA